MKLAVIITQRAFLFFVPRSSWESMSHENMYNAEKELCKGTLIEIEKLNDVKGIGRQRKQGERKQAPPPQQTILEYRNGVMARVQVAGSSSGGTTSHASDTTPFVAEGAELLAGLSEDQKRAVLTGEPMNAGSAATAVSDFARPLVLDEAPPVQPAPRGRAPPPSWTRHRKDASRTDAQQLLLAKRMAEADTDEEADPDGDVPGQGLQQRPELAPPSASRLGKRKDRANSNLLSFSMDDDPE